MFKRNLSLDKRLFEKKPHPNSAKPNLSAGNPPGAGKHPTNAGEEHLDAGKPPLSFGQPAADVSKLPFTAGKDCPNAGKSVEDAVTEENLDVFDIEGGNMEQKLVMQKAMSVSSISSEKEIDEDPTSVSDLERSGKRKSKMVSYHGSYVFRSRGIAHNIG